MIMDRLKDYAYAVKTWVKANPTKATLIGSVVLAFVLGAVIF